ncbi:hypothetical protein MMC14_003301 [Varicellaria rhodocarpa]|nr:hypothetical protein [Varicellaria rhodocarpa]
MIIRRQLSSFRHSRHFILPSYVVCPQARHYFSKLTPSITLSGHHHHDQSNSRISSVLSANKSWAAETANAHPTLFPTLAKTQEPKILWLGCSDSRVPETTVCGCLPGDIFVHRNIANVIHSADINTSAVIEYAVAHLKVESVVICGHDGCGGVKGALGNAKLGGVLDNWLAPVRGARLKLEQEPGWAKLDSAEKVKAVVEENVREGVRKVRENVNVVEGGSRVEVIGLCYNIADGILRTVDTPDETAGAERRAKIFCGKD